MNTSSKTTGKIDTKVLLSTLWIVVMINMLKADIFSLNIPGAAEEVARTAASTGASIPQLMLVGAGNKLTVTGIAADGVIGKLGDGRADAHLDRLVVETLCLLLIVWFAWKWRNPEGQP